MSGNGRAVPVGRTRSVNTIANPKSDVIQRAVRLMWRPKFSRAPRLYVGTLVLVVVAHAVMCYPAATCRGYPRIGPFWEIIALYVMFPAVFIAPMFDDFRESDSTRWRILVWFSLAMTFFYAVAQTNLHDVRPHTGHLAGFLGVILYLPIFVLGNMIRYLIIVAPFVFCMESVGRGFWPLLRDFKPAQQRAAAESGSAGSP